MSFRPKMTSFTEGISLMADLAWRGWDGVIADVWHVAGRQGGGGNYLSPDPRVVVFLDGGAEAVRITDRPGAAPQAAGAVAFIPAGMPVWSRITSDREFRHLDLHLDADRLIRRFDGAITDDLLANPVLDAAGSQIIALAAIIAQECTRPARHDLFGDGLIQALLAELFALSPQSGARGGLTARQLRRVSDHVEENLDGRIAIPDLACIAGLSESWFARAFKQTTGMPPHQWILRQRVARARALLVGSDLPLAQVATASGFADQAHLTRSFRAMTGATPAAWRRENGPCGMRPGGIRQNTTETVKTPFLARA